MIKLLPDLNKINFIKLHRKKRIRQVNKGLKGRRLNSYNLGLKTSSSTIINPKQLESFKKSLNRNLKTKERKNKKNFKIIKSIKSQDKAIAQKKKRKKEKIFFLRYNLVLGLTKKPLQVRMGKGKGNPVEWVYPVAKNRVLMEFNLKSLKKRKKIIRTLLKASKKLKVKTKVILVNKNDKLVKNFDSLSYNKELTKTLCVKEL